MLHNKQLIERRFGKSLARYHKMAVVQRGIARRLSELIPDINPEKGLEIGAGSGFLTELLVRRFPTAKWCANDITSQSRGFMPDNVEFICADGESLCIEPDTDIIASASTVQWFDDMPSFVKRCYESLAINGVISIATFGKDNFRQIPSQMEYYDCQQLRSMFADAGFTDIYVEQWHEDMTFENATEVLRHIKQTGVNAVTQTQWTPRELHKFIVEYPTPAVLTFHPIIIIARK